ncbi:MAG: cell division protein [Sphingobacteriales bacterium]|nr:MAG: cell division protein [Sphingobacteriales bacterium]
MPVIELETKIQASLEICFDLFRSIDLHRMSTARTNEVAIAGVTKGLIGAGEFVTWKATHFGIRQQLATAITAYNRPFQFRDEQLNGIFRKMEHDHFFAYQGDEVVLTDRFVFESPLGILGRLFNRWVLTDYLRVFLIERNQVIKTAAESGQWKQLLA